jgi:hypothetical protein
LHVIDLELTRPKEIPRFQCENRFIKGWDWSLFGRFRKAALHKHVDQATPILHTTSDRVSPILLEKLAPEQWKSLQLVAPRKLRFENDYCDQHRWRARFEDRAGNEYYLKVTDPDVTRRLELGHKISATSVLTVSLTKPWAPANGSKPALCYKLVAAVIEL